MLFITIIIALLSPLFISTAVGLVNHDSAENLIKSPLIQAKKGFFNVLYIYILPPAFYILFYILNTEATYLYIIQSFILIFFVSVISVIDFEYKIVPNTLLIYMITAWILTIIPQLILDFNTGFSQLLDAGLGFLLGGGLFLSVYIISRKNIGGGDVKLMAVIGLYVAVYRVLSTMFYSLLAAALTGIFLILLKKMNKKDSIPLSPFLFLGVFFTILFIN